MYDSVMLPRAAVGGVAGEDAKGADMYSAMTRFALVTQHRVDDPAHIAVLQAMRDECAGLPLAPDAPRFRDYLLSHPLTRADMVAAPVAGVTWPEATVLSPDNATRATMNALLLRRFATQRGVQIIEWHVTIVGAQLARGGADHTGAGLYADGEASLYANNKILTVSFASGAPAIMEHTNPCVELAACNGADIELVSLYWTLAATRHRAAAFLLARRDDPVVRLPRKLRPSGVLVRPRGTPAYCADLLRRWPRTCSVYARDCVFPLKDTNATVRAVSASGESRQLTIAAPEWSLAFALTIHKVQASAAACALRRNVRACAASHVFRASAQGFTLTLECLVYHFPETGKLPNSFFAALYVFLSRYVRAATRSEHCTHTAGARAVSHRVAGSARCSLGRHTACTREISDAQRFSPNLCGVMTL